ncbi:MAG: HemK family protein methyltransferase [Parcubacteria group bacterium]|nr:HemK family protein methyltransferase [Parcubacteria group bacterium]
MSTYLKEKDWLLREKYNGKETEEFFKVAKRLESGEPIDYLIGFFDFLGCKIDLSFRPLIPRTETEWWVERAVRNMPQNGISILDIFAGSGCIGIALLKHLQNATVDFGEKESGFLAQIEKNLTLNGIDPARAQVFISDVFTNIPSKKYNFIFANPPYISRAKIEAVQKSVLDNEPRGALFAEDDGLFYIKKLIDAAPQFLAAEGKLFIEFDSWQKPAIESYCQGSTLTVEFWKDQFDRWRVLVCSL